MKIMNPFDTLISLYSTSVSVYYCFSAFRLQKKSIRIIAILLLVDSVDFLRYSTYFVNFLKKTNPSPSRISYKYLALLHSNSF